MFKNIAATDPGSVADYNRFIRTIKKYEERYLPLRYSRKVEGMHETGYRTKEDLEKYVIIMADVSSSMDKKFLTSAIYFLYKVLMRTNFRKIRVDMILFAEKAIRYERIRVSKPENIYDAIDNIDLGEKVVWSEVQIAYHRLIKWKKRINGVAVISDYKFDDDNMLDYLNWNIRASGKSQILNIYLDQDSDQNDENTKFPFALQNSSRILKCVFEEE